MRAVFYILKQHEVKAIPDLKTQVEFMEKGPHQVAITEFPDGVWISTVFLGLDHDLTCAGEFFETMIFDKNGEPRAFQRRYRTWAEAEVGHIETVEQQGSET